jgi:hypothetical protein
MTLADLAAMVPRDPSTVSRIGQAPGVVVRDTTDRAGPALAFTAAWRTLLAEIRR